MSQVPGTNPWSRAVPRNPWDFLRGFLGGPMMPAPPQIQGHTETDFGYGTRNAVTGVKQGISNAWNAPGQAVVGVVNDATMTPARREAIIAQRQAAAPPPMQAPSGGGRSSANPFSIQSAVSFGNQFGTVTNSLRGPGDYERLKAAGYNPARNSLHNHGLAVDIVPKKGTSHAQLLEQYERAGFPVDRGRSYQDQKRGHSHIAFFGQQNPMQAARGVLADAAGGFGATPPAFNPAPFQQASQYYSQAAEAAKQPWSHTFTDPERPAPPTSTPFEAPDFSAGDAAFEAAAPKNPFDDPKERRAVQVQNYFKGLAQALGSINWSSGPGLGELFAKLGAGALAGRMHGEDVIREREELFERQMMEYNRARAGRDDNKAQAIAQTMNANIQQTNHDADKKWQFAVREIERTAPRVENGYMIAQVKNPDGTTTMTGTVLNEAMITAKLLEQRAQISLAMGAAQADHQRFEYSANESASRWALGTYLSMPDPDLTPQVRQDAVALDAASRVRAWVQNGTWEDGFARDDRNFGPEGDVTRIKAEAARNAGVPLDKNGQPLLHAVDAKLVEAYQDALASRILEYVTSKGRLQSLYTNPSAIAAYDNTRAANTSVRQSTNTRGRTSESVNERGW